MGGTAVELLQLGVQPFVFLLDDTRTHLHYMTKQTQEDPMRQGQCPLAAMQFCIDLLAAGCNCLEVPDARASVAYCMDELVVFEPQARQMAGVPIIKASGEKVGVLCVVSCYAQQSTASCRKGLTHVAAVLKGVLARDWA